MKHRTKAQKFNDYADAVKAMQKGQRPKRSRAKDGSIPTHPVVPVDETLSEAEVSAQCKLWLKKHNIFSRRNNVGGGLLDRFNSSYYTYGIKGAGDRIGLLPNGIYFETEFKAGKGGRLSAGQQKQMKNVLANNGLYFIIHGVPELEHYFKDLL